MSIEINPKKVLIHLLILITILVIINFIGLYIRFFIGTNSFIDVYSVDRWFNLDYERNIPTLYATITLIFTAFLLFIIGKFHKFSRTRFVAWYLLSAIFCFLSADEYLSIHERLIDPFRNYFSATGIMYFAWIIPYFILLLVMGIIFANFLYCLPRKFRNFFLLSGFIFVTGAMGMEMLGGYYISAYEETFTFTIITSIEESLEMIGIAIFIYSLLLYISTQFPENKFKIN